MPIYEYRCENGHTFDVMQRMSDDPITVCATCGAAVQRVFHPPSVHFKGSGFYNTDYGTKKRAREQRENGSSGEKKSAESGSSESKGGSSDSGSSSGGGDSKSSGGDSGTKSDGAAKASA